MVKPKATVIRPKAAQIRLKITPIGNGKISLNRFVVLTCVLSSSLMPKVGQ